jgi:ribosomal 50S subunit-recycling heat shock protein
MTNANAAAELSERADVFLVSHGFATSRSEAQAAIRAGRV